MTDPAITLLSSAARLLREIDLALDEGPYSGWNKPCMLKLRDKVRRWAKRMEAETP